MTKEELKDIKDLVKKVARLERIVKAGFDYKQPVILKEIEDLCKE